MSCGLPTFCRENFRVDAEPEDVLEFFFKQKTAYEIRLSLVGSEMCIRDSLKTCFKNFKKNTYVIGATNRTF